MEIKSAITKSKNWIHGEQKIIKVKKINEMKNESEECIQTEAWGGMDRKYRGRGETVKSSNTHVFEVPQGTSARERKRMRQMLSWRDNGWEYFRTDEKYLTRI